MFALLMMVALAFWMISIVCSPPPFDTLQKISGTITKIDYKRRPKSGPEILFIVESNNAAYRMIAKDPYPKQRLAHSLSVGQVVDASVYKELLLPTLWVWEMKASGTVYIGYADIAAMTKAGTEGALSVSYITGAIGLALLLWHIIRKTFLAPA
jgi:hypothetical protein